MNILLNRICDRNLYFSVSMIKTLVWLCVTISCILVNSINPIVIVPGIAGTSWICLIDLCREWIIC